MKKQEIEDMISHLKSIKVLTDKEEYLVSTEANRHFVAIFPVLNKELERLDTNKVEANCPSIMILKHEDNKNSDTFTNIINNKIHELIMQDYKIIDFGLQPSDPNIAFIKYTT